MDAISVGLFCVAGLIIVFMFYIIQHDYQENIRLEKLTCDELAFEVADEHASSFPEQIYRKKCIPPELQKASLLEISEYFTKQSCNDLAVHIVKKHFEYKQAQIIYTFKCGDPAKIDFVPLDIHFDKSPEPEPKKADSYKGRWQH